MAAAHPLKCTGSSSRQLSPDLLEVKFTMQGCMGAVQMQYVYMAVSEVTSANYATAVSQPCLRLGQMRYDCSQDTLNPVRH